MEIKYYSEYSHILQRDMEFKVFGHAGIPCIAFPAQSGNFYDFENFGMVQSIQDLIEEGAIQLFCVQSLDGLNLTSYIQDESIKMEQYNHWQTYICDELYPRLIALHNASSNTHYQGKMMVCGVSMGAFHALNLALKYPDKFDRALCLSGIYTMEHFIKHYQCESTYLNSPVDYMHNLALQHPLTQAIRENTIILCSGQGDYEQDGLHDLWLLRQEFERLQIPAFVDLWGQDVNHDWDWWTKQFPYYIHNFLLPQSAA